MIYLVSQIAVYLLLALGIGFIGGWLIQKVRSGQALQAATHEAGDRVENAEALREKYKATVVETEGQLADLKRQLSESEGRRELQVAEIASLKMDLNSFEDKDATINKFRHEADSLRQQLRSVQETASNYRSQLEIKARETAEYRLSSEKAHQQVVAMQKAQEPTSHISGPASQTVADMRERIGDLTGLVEKRDLEVQELQKMLAHARQEADTMQEQTEIARSQLHALEARIKDSQQSRKSSAQRATSHDMISTSPASPSNKSLRDELADRTRKYAVLDADYRELRKKYDRAKAQIDGVDAAGDRQLQSAATELEHQLKDDTAPGRPEFLLAEPSGQKDDLKQIFGIGPVIERTLNDIGVFHLSQIAGMTEQDILWVAETIDYFPKRIEQDNWVHQARQLLESTTR